MSGMTIIILALIAAKVIDLDNPKPLDFVIALLFLIDAIISVSNGIKRRKHGRD